MIIISFIISLISALLFRNLYKYTINERKNRPIKVRRIALIGYIISIFTPVLNIFVAIILWTQFVAETSYDGDWKCNSPIYKWFEKEI